MKRIIHSEDDMEAFGGRLASTLFNADKNGMVIYLHGPLGAGKTTLVRGFLRALGHSYSVKSPTYTLVESYHIQGRTIHHFDLYRLGDPEELEFIGVRDYFADESICLVEWPERGKGCLPTADIVIDLQYSQEDSQHGRILAINADTEAGRNIMAIMTK